MNNPQIVPLWITIAGSLGVGSFVGGLLTQYFLSTQRHREWAKDNKKQEWRELISTLTQSAHCIVENFFGASMVSSAAGIVSVSGDEERAAIAGANAEARRIIEDRIFIASEVQRENVLERWQLLAAEKNASRMLEYWNHLHDTLVTAANRDCGIKDRVEMNYHKGFIRLYAVVVACWIALCLAVAFSPASTPFAETKLPDEARKASFYRLPLEERRRVLLDADKDFAGLPLTAQHEVLAALSKEFEDYRRKRLTNAFELALIPPIVGYALFFLILPWIAAGFRTVGEA